MGRLLRRLRRLFAALLPARRVTISSAEVLTLDQLDQWADCYAAPCHDLDCTTCRPQAAVDRCCALDTADGAGHEGPCAYRCADCDGFGSCLTCSNGCACDDVTSCAECDGNHHCPYCDDGLVYEDGF